MATSDKTKKLQLLGGGFATKKQLEEQYLKTYVLDEGETVEDAPEWAEEVVDPYSESEGVSGGSGGCITGTGAPTTATKGDVGDFYMDTLTGAVYKCTAVNEGVYTWAALSVGDLTEINARIDELSGAIAGKLKLPKDESGTALYGTYGQLALSDGKGGVVWGNASSGGGSGGESVTSSKSVTINGNGTITDCIDGDMSVTGFTLPDGATEMVVTARKSVNIFDPDLFVRGTTDSTLKKLANGEEVTTKGLTLKYANGILTVNGTATAQCNIDFINISNPFWLKAGTYQFAACPPGGSSTSYAVQWRRIDTGAVFWTDFGQNGNPNKTFDVDVSIRAAAVIYSGYTCNNVQFRCQILSGLPNTDTSGWSQYYPFEGESVIINSNSTAPISGLPAFKDYTAVDCVGGSVTLEYPILTSGGGSGGGSIVIPETAIERHHDDAEFTVTKLNNSNQFSQNDITFVGDEFWMSKENSTYYDNGTMIFRYKITDGEFSLVGTCDCDFGHLNTMDYCAANDCLIFGNGGNGTETTGNYFVVVPNPRALGDTALIADVGIKYNVDIGYKVQALWGGSNLGDNNIVYLLSNNAANITKILLLKDENGEFNGEYVTLETHELDPWGVQGAEIFGDTLYIGGQFNGNEYAAVKEISLSDYSTIRTVKRKFYAADGTAVIACVQGIYVNSDAVWICVNSGDATKPVWLTKYRR